MRSGHREDQEGPQVLSDGLEREGADRRDDEEVEGPPLDAQHHLVVYQVCGTHPLRDGLEDHPSEQREREQGTTAKISSGCHR
jgi:hypothetical protein